MCEIAFRITETVIILNLKGYLDWINQAEDIEPVNDDEQEDEQQFNGMISKVFKCWYKAYTFSYNEKK